MKHWLIVTLFFGMVMPMNGQFETKKFSCNERELNANGTVDNVVSYQFLRILYNKFPKTGCNIFKKL